MLKIKKTKMSQSAYFILVKVPTNVYND